MRKVRKRRTRQPIRLAKIEKAVRSILEAIGENPKRKGLQDTPRRVAQLYERIFSGIGRYPPENLKLYRVGNQDGMILVRDISFHSMCEHHLLPFFGKVHLAYVPSKNRVAGLSSLTKIVEVLSRKLQLQERLANEIADVLTDVLDPKGLLVIVEAEHLCMAMNDAQKPGTTTVSLAARGSMLEESTRTEAFSLMSGQSRARTGKAAPHRGTRARRPSRS